ncbi:MAG: class II fructose-bisphosphate aldolase [Elusimicrobiota bacterium]
MTIKNQSVSVANWTEVREHLDQMIWEAVFAGNEPDRLAARRLIIELAKAWGAKPASIQEIYLARGKGEISGFTVPAINIRGLTYEVAQAVFRTAASLEAGAFIFELARSEIGYTDQRPSEFSACVLGAAVKTGFKGPVFIQGDHYQVSAKKFKSDAEGEIGGIEKLIQESLDWDYGNIDIDASTIVDLSRPTLEDQQRDNAVVTARLAGFIRSHEKTLPVSIGGEIGEVGKSNSRPDELEAYMKLLLEADSGKPAISKVSVQTGTSHGGVVLAGGELAQVKISFETLGLLSRLAREKYGMAGAVQHGASTLPEDAFDKFPEVQTAEIHLATGFQNIMYDHLPAQFKEHLYEKIRRDFASERGLKDTEEQFLYKTRKKMFGPAKKDWWGLDRSVKEKMMTALQAKFTLIFQKLKVNKTKALIDRRVAAFCLAKPLIQDAPRLLVP